MPAKSADFNKGSRPMFNSLKAACYSACLMLVCRLFGACFDVKQEMGYTISSLHLVFYFETNCALLFSQVELSGVARLDHTLWEHEHR